MRWLLVKRREPLPGLLFTLAVAESAWTSWPSCARWVQATLCPDGWAARQPHGPCLGPHGGLKLQALGRPGWVAFNRAARCPSVPPCPCFQTGSDVFRLRSWQTRNTEVTVFPGYNPPCVCRHVLGCRPTRGHTGCDTGLSGVGTRPRAFLSSGGPSVPCAGSSAMLSPHPAGRPCRQRPRASPAVASSGESGWWAPQTPRGGDAAPGAPCSLAPCAKPGVQIGISVFPAT